MRRGRGGGRVDVCRGDGGVLARALGAHGVRVGTGGVLERHWVATHGESRRIGEEWILESVLGMARERRGDREEFGGVAVSSHGEPSLVLQRRRSRSRRVHRVAVVAT